MPYRRKNRLLEPKKTGFALNVTSMTDMFTILLVFLLQTYATSDVEVKMDENLRLPSSNSDLNPTRSVQVSISKTELKLNDNKLVGLSEGHFSPADIDQNDGFSISALATELQKLSGENEKEEGNIFVLADESLDFETIRQVMYTTSMAGFPKVKLATVIGQ